MRMIFLYSLLLLICLPFLRSQTLEFSIEPKSVVVRQGDPAILNCQTKSKSKNVLIYWKKGKTGWISDYSNKPFRILANHSLYFPSVGRDEEDYYICAAFILQTNQRIYSKTPAYITIAYISSNFVQPPSPTTVREHTTAIFTCISGASQPLPDVKWEKDDRPVLDPSNMAQHYNTGSNTTSGTLQLRNVSLADAGYYVCVAVNPLLPEQPRTSAQALLLVLPKDDRPRIEVHPVNRISAINRPLQMDCVIVGVPAPLVHWVHNGQKVTNTSNRLVYSNGSLYFKSLSLKDDGEYSCNGTNDKGSVASSNIFLGVAYIQYDFAQNPRNTTAVNSSRVVLECRPPVHFPNQLKYKWYRNYRVMTMDDRKNISSSGSLVFKHVLKSDEGVYVCEATNEFSHQTRTSTEGYLTINVPPYFLSNPSNQTVVLHRKLRMVCVAQGSPTPRITWYHGNTLLSNSSRFLLGTDGSLELAEVEIADAGVYACSAENVAGKRIAVAYVIVHVPPNGTVVPGNKSVVLGHNASFHCQFDGNPPPSLTWYFSQDRQLSALLPSNSSQFIQTTRQLHILNVTEENKGWYTCIGENDVGQQNFSAHLNVLVPAVLVTFPRNTTVNQSDVAEMTCSGYGNPAPSVTWSKDGRLIIPDAKMTLNGSNLQIKDVTRNDAGYYSCTVRNNLGRQTSSAYLVVQVSATIQSVLGPSRVQWRNNVVFQCKFDGVPEPEIAWLKDNIPITYASRVFRTGNDLVLISTRRIDTGNYTCRASNLVGSATATKQLIVEVPPDRPMEIHFGNITSSSMQVLWRSGFDGHSPIASFRLERRTSVGLWNTVSHTIAFERFTMQYLTPYTWYYVRVFARNKIGWSEASKTINASTEEAAPSIPLNVSCTVSNASSVYVSWRQPSRPSGIVRQYSIHYKRLGSSAVQAVTTSEMSSSVHGLQSFTFYQFRVQARTLWWGNYSSYVTCRSGEAEPSAAPQNLSLISLGSNTILVAWQLIPAGSENGIVRKYYIRYRKTSDERSTLVPIPGNKTVQFNITGLSAWSEYAVQVSAATVDTGPWSEERTARTFESAPSAPPTNIIVNGNTSRSLLVSWSPPSADQRNGVIAGYLVLYSPDGTVEPSMNMTTNESSLHISGLLIFTVYAVQIRAFTSAGYGPLSARHVARTLESYPGVVGDVTQSTSDDSILVTWTAPAQPNGVITSYIVYYNITLVLTVFEPENNLTITNITHRSRNVSTRVTRVTLDIIHGNVTYSLCIAARTSIGFGMCTDPIIFATNFTLKPTPEPKGTPGEFTPSIVDDHLPIIAGGATIFAVALVALFTCFMIRRRNRKNEEKQAKQRYNFRSHAFPMGAYDDGESSVASHTSKPTQDHHSVDSSSLQSRTNPSNAFASRLGDGRDASPLVRLRNNSLNLGSEASSYDNPYSSVDEIGVDLSFVSPDAGTLPPAIPDRDRFHSADNPLYPEANFYAGDSESGSVISHAVANPLYESSLEQPAAELAVGPQEEKTDKPRKANPAVEPATRGTSESSMLGEEYFSSDEEGPRSFPYEELVMPPPPAEFSDSHENPYNVAEPHQTLDNGVTDF